MSGAPTPLLTALLIDGELVQGQGFVEPILNPVWVILAIMVFGNFLGFLGLLLAVPIAAALKVLVVEGVAYYKVSPVFEGDTGVVESEAPDDEPSVRRKKRR